jgi:hypothetical protein
MLLWFRGAPSMLWYFRHQVSPTCLFLLVSLCFTQAQERYDVEAPERARKANLMTAPPIEASEQSASPHSQTVPVRSFEWSAIAHTAGDSTSAEHISSSSAEATVGDNLVVRTFQGPLGGTPPDPMLAAGPVNVMATVNGQYAVYDKSGKLLSSVSPSEFFPGETFFWDTRILFDPNTQRFIIVAAAGDQRTRGSAFLGVSASSDATGRWNVFQLLSSTQYWVDFPGLGVTSNAVFIALFRNPFPSTGGLAQCPLLVIGMPELLQGNSALNITQFDQVLPFCSGSAGPVLNLTSSTAGYLLAQTAGGNGNVLTLLTLETSGKPTLTTSTVPVPHYNIPEPPPQPGTITTIVRPGSDIYSAVFRNGSVWAVQSVKPDDGNSAGVRWYEIDPKGKTVRQFGTITGAGNAYVGAITVLPTNEVFLVYTTSSDKQFASAGYGYRSAVEPPGAITTTGIYQAGSGTYSYQRWGDFAAISVDADGHAWGHVEYASGNESFRTAIVELAAPVQTPPPQPTLSLTANPSAATVKSGSSAQFAITVSGQNLAAPISLSCSGLPKGATCNFNPASLNASGNSTLTITTSAASAALKSFGWTLVVALGFAGLCWAPSSRGGRRWLALISLGLVITFVACGGVGSSVTSSNQSPPGGTTPPPSPPQSFAIIVTATSGSTQANTGVTLTVQ